MSEHQDNNPPSLLDLFRTEAETHLAVLDEQLPALEKAPGDGALLDALMRAAHSLKGAARIVDLEPGVRLAHDMEEVLVAAQRRRLAIDSDHVVALLQATDLYRTLIGHADDPDALGQAEPEVERIVECLREALGEAGSAGNSNPAAAMDPTMRDLFQGEAAAQLETLNNALLQLETDPGHAETLEALMRAAHSIKGAARMVGLEATVALAHRLEDCFVAAQRQQLRLTAEDIDQLLRAVDRLRDLCEQIGDTGARDDQATDPDPSPDPIMEGLAAILARRDGNAAPPTDDEASPTAPARHPTATPAPELDPEMLELFRTEADAQLSTVADGLLRLEQNPRDADTLEAVMRASHSVKGAARMVGIDPAVELAHLMEDIFVAAQKAQLELDVDPIDLLLQVNDALLQLAQSDDIPAWCEQQRPEHERYREQMRKVLAGEPIDTAPAEAAGKTQEDSRAAAAPAAAGTQTAAGSAGGRGATAIRVSTESLNRLMGLAGEVQVEARWLRPFADGLLHIKQRQTELISMLDRMRDQIESPSVDEYTRGLFHSVLQRASDCRHLLSERLTDLEEYDRRSHNLATRLNREVIASRMRPFADGVHGFQRMVRDVSRSLGKQVNLEILGLETRVDRDILEKIEAPLNHLLRNAVDHGLETPERRRQAGKPEQGHLKLEAIHSAGMLSIIAEDDGAGIEPEQLREKIVAKNLVSEEMARDLTEAELMEFIFLPGFSSRDSVTEISGRGVGLDVVHSVVQEMHGLVHAISHPGRGMRFHMQLPLTLSVMRTLLVEIAGEPYAFPLAQINRTLKIDRSRIEVMEGRQYFTMGNQHIGLVAANQLLGLPEAPPNDEQVSIVVLGERLDRYGFVVDRFLGERSMVVNPIDPRLGKVRDIAAASLLEDGNPCLILDIDDLLRSADLLISGGRLDHIDKARAREKIKTSKRVLVVDDSITVREVERNMLANIGYEVEVAVDGMDGWNAVRVGDYDLVISDIDMPRMNGFEFVGMIKQDPQLKALPVMIVSYKDREEDRTRGLEVGADYYLTKGSFQDATLIDAVLDLIGEP